MSRLDTASEPTLEKITNVTRRYWGIDRLRPLQEEAIRAGIAQRDSVVVLPTGGGKSLCYQVPPLLAERTDIVVSPLISLMKDQVDALRTCGYPAAALHSGMPPEARREVETALVGGRYRLVFVTPERLVSPPFLQLTDRLKIRAIAIDEAHCISHWGHDFRPEYRRLAIIKERFPKTGVQAYTATATQRVRTDIAEQLGLTVPLFLIGRFDRPNLVYRVVPLLDLQFQLLEVIRRHAGEAVIVYCITRKDTERVAAWLQSSGVRADAYHAGMDSDRRRRIQDAFSEENLDVIVATVAFGMGIDRSNVRCVIHAAMPKSVEHYQQETGRAGRDGLEAECVLFYSAAAAMRWESLIRRSAEDAREPEERIHASLQQLEQMQRFCSRLRCRHRALSEYFGQPYEPPDCGACDVCLDEVEGMADATITAQKIISCVARVHERYGAKYVVDVLMGAETEQVRQRGHKELSTYGLLSDQPRGSVMNMLYQLIDLGLLIRTEGDRPVIMLNDASWSVLRGERKVRLQKPKTKPVKKTRADTVSWKGVHRGLFERLRYARRTLAAEHGVPAYIIFGDVTLREMARLRPRSLEALRRVRGVGDKKLADFGDLFLNEIDAYCRDHDLATDSE
jgi:ATP-dependent DNA helicase RecQ